MSLHPTPFFKARLCGGIPPACRWRTILARFFRAPLVLLLFCCTRRQHSGVNLFVVALFFPLLILRLPARIPRRGACLTCFPPITPHVLVTVTLGRQVNWACYVNVVLTVQVAFLRVGSSGSSSKGIFFFLRILHAFFNVFQTGDLRFALVFLLHRFLTLLEFWGWPSKVSRVQLRSPAQHE